MAKRTYNFSLILEGIEEFDDAAIDALFEAGCDDAMFGERDSVAVAEFDREAENISSAVLSAMHNVESAVPDLRVVRVEPDDLVSLSVIAERTKRSRESARLLSTGKRGPGGFPEPLAWIDAKTKVWQWSEVAAWFEGKLGEDVQIGAGAAQFIAALNGLLEARHQMASLQDIAANSGPSDLAFSSDAIEDLPGLVDEAAQALRHELTLA